MLLLGKVKEIIHIESRGTIFVIEFSSGRDWTNIRVGEEVEIHTAEGCAIRCRIKGGEHLRPLKDWMPRSYGIRIEDPAPQVAIGAAVWLLPKEQDTWSEPQ